MTRHQQFDLFGADGTEDLLARQVPADPLLDLVATLPDICKQCGAAEAAIGAGPIAAFIYAEDTDDTRRNVYRNPFGFSFFKHGNTLAALKSQIRAELIEAQQASRQKKLNKEISPVPVPKRRRYRRGVDEATA